MSDCGIADQIAKHCDEVEEVLCCYSCEELVKSEDDLTEVKTKYDDYQFIGDCCIDEYITEGI